MVLKLKWYFKCINLCVIGLWNVCPWLASVGIKINWHFLFVLFHFQLIFTTWNNWITIEYTTIFYQELIFLPLVAQKFPNILLLGEMGMNYCHCLCHFHWIILYVFCKIYKSKHAIKMWLSKLDLFHYLLSLFQYLMITIGLPNVTVQTRLFVFYLSVCLVCFFLQMPGKCTKDTKS